MGCGWKNLSLFGRTKSATKLQLRLVGWPETRVQLRLSFRHQAEFQRRADGRGLMFAKLLQILFQLRICMGTADNHQRRARIADLNIYFPALEPVVNKSSSLSKNVVTDLLKEIMNYDGIIFTDGLEMKGAYNGTDPDSVCLQAIMAGNDILLLPINVDASIQIIIDAAKSDDEVKNRVSETAWTGEADKILLGTDYRVQFPNQ